MHILWLVVSCCISAASAVLCFNCSATQLSLPGCAGVFIAPAQPFNSSRELLVNCRGEDAMCFVRSWKARATHLWIVQRGCYHSKQGHALPNEFTTLTTTITCKNTRLSDAEYKVCLCQADWCNTSHNFAPRSALLILVATGGVMLVQFIIMFS